MSRTIPVHSLEPAENSQRREERSRVWGDGEEGVLESNKVDLKQAEQEGPAGGNKRGKEQKMSTVFRVRVQLSVGGAAANRQGTLQQGAAA